MAYIGQEPKIEFSSVPTKDSFTGDGSTVAFDLSAAVATGAENALEVFVDNVRQEPGSGKAYTLGLDGSNDNKRITFTAAPANGAAIYVINDKSNTTTLVTPTNLGGVELILDADSDTSITADTDDQIDIKIAAADHLQIKSSSGDTVLKPMVDAKDIIFQQFDGNKIFCIDDGNFVSVGGNSAAPGEIRIYEDTDLGANYTGFKAGNLTASVAYQLPLADGSSGQALATDGSGVLSWTTVSANTPSSADGQALGSASLEWSDLFLADGAVINLGADQDVTLTHVADTGVLLNGASVIQFRDSGLTIGSNADGDLDIVSDGTAVDSINIESAGGITLDAGTAGSGVIYEDDGTEMMRIHNSSSDVIIETKVSDKDFIIKGNDGGSVITPFTLDMSAGGDLFLTGGLIDLKNDGSAVSQIKFYCESSNAHAQTLIGAPHSESATNTLTLPSSGGDAKLVSVSSTATLTNKTLTTPVIAEIDSGSTITLDATTDIVLDADGGDIFFKDAGTTFGSATNTSGNLIIKSGTTTAATFSGANVTFAGTIGSGAITSTGIVTGTGFTAGNAVLAEAELELLDGLTAGTAIASKVVTTDANIDTTGMRNLTISGELDAATGDFSGAVDVAGAITSSAGATITVSDNSDNLTLTCTDADGSAGPNLRMYRNSSSPDDGNDLGVIDFEGRNDNSQDVVYAQIKSLIEDQADGAEDGKLELYHMFNGSLAPSLQLTSAGVVINESSNDIDFRVESNGNTHMLFVDGGNNQVTIGGNLLVNGTTPTVTIGDAGAEDAKIVFDGNAVDYVVGLDDSADEFRIGVGSGLGSDRVMEINSSGVTTFQKAVTFAGSTPTVTVGDGGAEDAKILFDGNAQNFYIGLDDSTDKLTIGLGNALGTTPGFTMDENTNVVFPDNQVTIQTTGTGDHLTLVSTDAGTGVGPNIVYYRNSSSPAANDYIGEVTFRGRNAASQDVDYARINTRIKDVTDGGENANVIFNVMRSGSEVEVLRYGEGTVIFNEGSADQDFRVESNNNANMFKVDAGDDRTHFGGTSYQGQNLGVHNFHSGTTTDQSGLQLGSNTASYANALFKIGCLRDQTNSYNFVECYTGNGSDNINDDLEFKVKGDGNVSCDESFTGSGADYAEYFEWKDGNASDEDRIGISVKLDGNKIVPSSDSDNASDIIGVVSGSPVIVGDADGTGARWTQKYLKDDYGRKLKEEYTVTTWRDEANKQDHSYATDRIPSDVTVPSDAKVTTTELDGVTKLLRPKINPDYDKTKTYVSREDRKEWDTVGLVGKLRIKKGQKTGTNWIKMRDISDTVEEWLIR